MSLSGDDFDEVSDPSDRESNLCEHVWFGQWFCIAHPLNFKAKI